MTPGWHVFNASEEAEPEDLCNEQTQGKGSNPESEHLCVANTFKLFPLSNAGETKFHSSAFKPHTVLVSFTV